MGRILIVSSWAECMSKGIEARPFVQLRKYTSIEQKRSGGECVSTKWLVAKTQQKVLKHGMKF